MFQIDTGLTLASDIIYDYIFGTRVPSPFLAHSEFHFDGNHIIINTESPFWKLLEEDGFDISRVMVEVICHEELECLIHDEYCFRRAGEHHKVIAKVLSHTGVLYLSGADYDEGEFRKLQLELYEEVVKKLYQHSKKSWEKRKG